MDDSILVVVRKLRKLCDPYRHSIWVSTPVTIREVDEALRTGNLNCDPYNVWVDDWSRTQHINRIAWLVAHGWTEPIEVDVGVPSLGCHVSWPILDGNHRMAAAIYRNDLTIPASVSGEERLIKSLLQQ